MDQSPPATRPIRHPVILLLQAVIIALAGWYVFLPALHGGWLWDDMLDIVGYPLLRHATGLRGIWIEPPSPRGESVRKAATSTPDRPGVIRQLLAIVRSGVLPPSDAATA